MKTLDFKANQPKWLYKLVTCEAEDIHIDIPSGQAWNNMSPKQRKIWREFISSQGLDPEDYLDRMRAMLPHPM